MAKQRMKIYLFFCSNSLDPDAARRCAKNQDDEQLKIISLPCSGKVDLLYLIKAFETGADGVVIVTCRQDACRYLEGNLRATKRAQAVDTLLEEVGLGKGRIIVLRPQEEDTVEQIIREVDAFRATIKGLAQGSTV